MKFTATLSVTFTFLHHDTFGMRFTLCQNMVIKLVFALSSKIAILEILVFLSTVTMCKVIQLIVYTYIFLYILIFLYRPGQGLLCKLWSICIGQS